MGFEYNNILVTGAAGFIGWRVCEFLLRRPELIPSSLTGEGKGVGTINVVGIDNMNNYYDTRLKEWRLKQLKKYPNFKFRKIDIENHGALKKLFQECWGSKKSTAQSAHNRRKVTSTAAPSQPEPPFTAVINLAARAGVRYSLENPFVYYTTNIMGNLNLLELCREFGVKKFILASSSSIYAGQEMPFKEDLPVNQPMTPYAASKKSAEVTCYTYHKLYGIDVTILRYFTVYGPASRPDMCPLRFISWIDQGKPVIIYGDGSQSRDFTYIDDIARGTIMALKPLGYEIVNLGGDEPHKLLDFLHMIEQKLNKKAKIECKPFHPADMKATWADIIKARRVLGWQSIVRIEQGIEYSIGWYLENKVWTSKIVL